MQNTKAIKGKKLCFMAIIFIVAIAMLWISFSGIITAQAEVAENPIGYEEKIYTEVDIDDDFDDSCVMVVMDKYASGFNKSHTSLFSKIPFVKAIRDLTRLTGDIAKKLYLNRESFRQIFRVDLQEPSKQNVLDTISELQKLDGVLWAGVSVNYSIASLPANAPSALSGNQYPLQWGTGAYQYGINAPGAWEYSVGSIYTKVGIIDTGIADHEDLRDNVKAGWNFVDNNDNTNDSHGHGTEIAGIIGATGTNENGVIGVNWKVKMIPLKVDYDDDTYGKKLSGSAIIDAINWAADNDVEILNASFGSYTEDVGQKMAINNFKGLVVCAAGNYGKDNDTAKFYPAAYSQGQEFSNRVISVGAIDMFGGIWSSSNYGANSVDVFAPGVTILSTVPLEKDSSGYDFDDGTSLAAPFVTGVAALLYSRYDHYKNYMEKAQVAEQVKTTILNNVTKDDRYSGYCVTGGRLNAAEAMKHCRHIPKVMSGYGYYDGWYYWKGQVDMNMSTPNAYDFNDDGEVVIKKHTDISFGMIHQQGFNAVSKIYLDMGFMLTNSSGQLVVSSMHSETFGIFSTSAYGYYWLNLSSRQLPNHEKYTLTWICDSTRKNYKDHYVRSYSFYLDID